MCLLCCTGSGMIACLFSIIFSIVLSAHISGFVSPKWYKDDGSGYYRGIYYNCRTSTDCYQEVHDEEYFTLAVIVVISSFVLFLAFLILTCCTHYRYVSLGLYMTMLFGGWFVIQELVTMILLIMIATDYDEVGWSAYVFALPGIAAIPIIALLMIAKKCGDGGKVGFV